MLVITLNYNREKIEHLLCAVVPSAPYTTNPKGTRPH